MIDKVLRKEVVPIGFVVVSTDVELLGLGPAFHLNFTALPLLLAENCRVVQTPPLRFQFHTKQTLRTSNQAAVQWHADVSRLNVFQDVVLLSLKANVHLVFEIEQRLGVELGAKLNLVSNFAAEVELNPLVKIHRPRPALALGNPRVFRVVPSVAQGDFCRPLWLDFNLIAAEDHLKELAVDLQLRGKSAVRFIFLFLQFVPELTEVTRDVVVQILVQGEHTRRSELEGVADGLLHLIQARDGVVNHAIIEIAGPLQRDAAGEFSRIEQVPIVVGKGKVE